MNRNELGQETLVVARRGVEYLEQIVAAMRSVLQYAERGGPRGQVSSRQRRTQRAVGRAATPATTITAATRKPAKKSRMSAAARARIVAAQRKRWDKYHAEMKQGKRQPHRTISPAGRRGMKAGADARWAEERKRKGAKARAARATG